MFIVYLVLLVWAAFTGGYAFCEYIELKKDEEVPLNVKLSFIESVALSVILVLLGMTIGAG